VTDRRSRANLNSNEGFRPCLRRDTRHTERNVFCNCLRTELPVEARAMSSGALGTPERNHHCPECTDGISPSRPPHPRFANFVCPRCAGSGELTARGPLAIHQHGRCSIEKCGGEFTCEGCKRVVGLCMGAGDELGADHCDDCYCDRLAVLDLIKKDGQQSRAALKLRVGAKAKAWQRDPVTVARELCEDGFLQFNGAGRFAMTPRGREALR
jgi:hypothetical protein